MKIVRNARTFKRLEKIIKSGRYNKEEMLLDIADFVSLRTLTQEEHDSLVLLIEEFPPTLTREIIIDEGGNIVSDSTYLLLNKQIEKMVYSAEVVEQMTSDFRMTGAISRHQFGNLIDLINELYYPIVEQNPEILPEKI